MDTLDLRTIAMYLPQFHQIPENDQWWGEGFTEWTNVKKSKPRFEGHYQPHVPSDLGYYDLRDPYARSKQAELAKAYGISGFCYYHYWFNGKRLLEHPFNEVLANGEPDFPFCLCWANENWSRRWDGSEQQLLMEQKYSDQDSLDFINSLIPAFRDKRYIRVNQKPLLLLYRTALLPDAKRTAEIWREAMIKAGIGEIYLVRVENRMDNLDEAEIAPSDIGFDAAMEFAPYWGSIGKQITNLSDCGLPPQQLEDDLRVYDYTQCMLNMLSKPNPSYKLFRGAFPSWDNSARRKTSPLLFVNSSPESYAYWVSQIARYTLERYCGDERLIFINAWNEWGEGCHLEPDEKYGQKYLEAHRLGLKLAKDAYEVSLQNRLNPAPFPSSVENWFQLLSTLYKDTQGLGPQELKQLDTFIPSPTLEPQQRTMQLQNLVAEQEKEILALHNSASWRLTAPLRKMFDLLFK
ncbi:glycoside hydrolase family 99-like domain-containing protein [Geomonas ferrireducens]|uniref:glycoside hydrolase family 99-like domain-containing protein n=1 Tax=Geomonas ferrireducens TaxID=2570227 RepID=UPI0010A912FF|nr:glycoside hydrolase family 99-like domain-containing protein [Geomonas ferrireducens]